MAVDIQSMIIAQYMKEIFKTPEEKEVQALRLESLRRGQSPAQAYKTNIDLKAGDYKTSIDLDALGTRKTELEVYRDDRLKKDKNILPTTIDYIDNMIEDMNKRATTVAAFNTSIDELANIENNLDRIVTDYMNPDATSEVKSAAIDELKKVNVSRMDISSKIQGLDRNRYLKDNNLRLLDSDMKMKGSFAIDAIHSDKLMDNHEYGIWQNAIDSDNQDIIKQYYLDQSTFKRESAKDMIEGFGAFATNSMEAYDDMIRIEKESGKGSNSYIDARTEYNNQRNTLYTLKNQMEESMGIGKVNTLWNQIFPDGTPWKSPTKPLTDKFTSENLLGLRGLGYSDDDISKMTKESGLGIIKSGTKKPIIGKYDDIKAKLDISTQPGVKREGLATIKKMEGFDKEEESIKTSIKSLEEEGKNASTRLEDVKKDLTAILNIFGTPNKIPSDQKKRYDKLIEERTRLTYLIKSPQNYERKLEKLNNSLEILQDKRNETKARLENISRVL